jgi:hypothetical protein
VPPTATAFEAIAWILPAAIGVPLTRFSWSDCGSTRGAGDSAKTTRLSLFVGAVAG